MSAGQVEPETQTAFEAILASEAEGKRETPAKVAKATQTVESPEPEPEESTPEAELEAALEAEPVEGAEDAELEAGAEEEVTEEPAAEEAEDKPVESLGDLAKWAGVEETQLLDQIQVAGPDGKPVSLGNVIKEYSSSAANGQLTSQLQARAATVDKKLSDYEAERDVTFGNLQQITARLIKLTDEDEKIDWKKLEAEDPQQYTYLKQKQAERTEAIRASAGEMLRERARLETQTAEAKQKWIQEEAVKLLKARPEWVPKDVRDSVIADVTNYMHQYGFEPEIYGDILPDHRVTQLVWKAAQYDKMQAKKPLTLKALEAAKEKPRLIVRPTGSTRVPAKDARQLRVRQAQKRLANSGRVEDAAAYFRETM